MSTESKKKTVDMAAGPRTAARPRPSIRREPLPASNAFVRKLDKIDWRSPEWERRVVVIGIVLFSLAFAIITFGVSAISAD